MFNIKPEFTEKIGPKLNLVMTLPQLIEEHYPLPGEENFVFSQDEYNQISEDSPLFSIDCEMCLTSSGALELTRICIVNSDLDVVYETLVKPDNPITNHLTKFSGKVTILLVYL